MEPSSRPEMRMIDVLVAQHHFRYQKKTATERIQQSRSHFDKQGSLWQKHRARWSLRNSLSRTWQIASLVI